ncbi:hypothetical protein [Herbaspirillum huttiense]|uniref:hypothetical protein n=1 Tax=Herbaspirillum huttiense TaxID=863372 RepID=UPI002E77F220|nr:hypothetical protein [Herbaspirillum huttiense]MEE1635624.1 hypothetical protein [Herbaspirillum huttiense NC40101]
MQISPLPIRKVVRSTVTDEQIEVMFFADEACVESRSLRLDQGKWLLYGLGAGCD